MENNTSKQSSKKVIIAVVVILLVVLAMFGIYKVFMPKGETGAKEITVTVVHADQSSKDFTYHTDAAYLGEVIQAEGLVEGEENEFGLFIMSADGETADEAKQQWWAITKGGERVDTGASQTPIEDGDHFELTLTEGY